MEHKIKIFNILPVFCLAIILVVSSGALYAENHDSARSMIETLNAEWNQAFNSGDIEQVGELYDQHAVLSPGNGEVLIGRAAIKDLFRSFIENGVHDHSIEIINVHADGDTMYEVSKWSAYGQEKEGEKPMFGGILVNIFHKDKEGNWKSHIHTWNVSS